MADNFPLAITISSTGKRLIAKTVRDLPIGEAFVVNERNSSGDLFTMNIAVDGRGTGRKIIDQTLGEITREIKGQGKRLLPDQILTIDITKQR